MKSEIATLNWTAIHGRGVLNTGHAETFARTLATAGTISGRESCFYMRYDDSPERDNIPMIFYAVMGNPKINIILPEEVKPIGAIFKAIVVMESTLLINETSQRSLLFDGVKKDALLIVNTSLPSRAIINLVEKYSLAQEWVGKLVTVRAKKYDTNIAFPLLAALVKAWNIISIEDLKNALNALGAKNKIAIVERVYNEVQPVDVTIVAGRARSKRKAKSEIKQTSEPWNIKTYRKYQEAASQAKTYGDRMNAMPNPDALQAGLIEFGPLPGEKNIGFKTSSARYCRPLKDEKKCTQCKLCTIYCPDGCIDFDQIQFDWDYCKGCGVCEQVCPSGAIRMVPELFAKEGLTEKESTSIEDALMEYGY